ncbi:MAG: YlxR family protein [Campylobacter sp.]|nr:YlxR family protein [Campylobacter sp.]
MKNRPIRMCVVCRQRQDQNTLKRYRIKNFTFSADENGRSFYICKACLHKDGINFKKILSKYINLKNCENNELKEKLLNG